MSHGRVRRICTLARRCDFVSVWGKGRYWATRIDTGGEFYG